MRRMLYAALQNETTNETTNNVIEEAGRGAAETAGRTVKILQGVAEPFSNFFGYLGSTEFISNIIATIIVGIFGILVYEVLTHGAPRLIRRRRTHEIMDAETVARIKRQDTAITLVRNILRYVVFAIVVLIALSIFLRDALATVGGAALLAAIIGFGAQSFLRDIIAGFSIIFEGQYSVGDFVYVMAPHNVSGVVEELGLRMTKIRSLSGEVSYIPNGTMMGVTNYVSGEQRFNVEVQLSDAEAVQRVVNSLGEASELYLTPPRLVEREERDGRVRLRIVAGVLPSMAWLVEENLTERIKAAAGEESLAAAPLVYNVDQENLRRIRNLLPQEAERKLPPP